jgi:hypothetical protein
MFLTLRLWDKNQNDQISKINLFLICTAWRTNYLLQNENSSLIHEWNQTLYFSDFVYLLKTWQLHQIIWWKQNNCAIWAWLIYVFASKKYDN